MLDVYLGDIIFLLQIRSASPLILDQNYINTKNQVIKAERRVLKELGFCVHVKHPHKVGHVARLSFYMVVGIEPSAKLLVGYAATPVCVTLHTCSVVCVGQNSNLLWVACFIFGGRKWVGWATVRLQAPNGLQLTKGA